MGFLTLQPMCRILTSEKGFDYVCWQNIFLWKSCRIHPSAVVSLSHYIYAATHTHTHGAHGLMDKCCKYRLHTHTHFFLTMDQSDEHGKCFTATSASIPSYPIPLFEQNKTTRKKKLAKILFLLVGAATTTATNSIKVLVVRRERKSIYCVRFFRRFVQKPTEYGTSECRARDCKCRSTAGDAMHRPTQLYNFTCTTNNKKSAQSVLQFLSRK